MPRYIAIPSDLRDDLYELNLEKYWDYYNNILIFENNDFADNANAVSTFVARHPNYKYIQTEIVGDTVDVYISHYEI